MPANTSPDNIVYPVSTDAVSPLETVFANMAQSVQDALTVVNGNFVPGAVALTGVQSFANATARSSAIPSPTSGMRTRREDLNVTEEYLTTSDGVAADGWYPVFGMVPYCQLAVSGLSIGSGGSGTTISTWTETKDAWGMHDAVTNPDRITAPVAGRYLCTLTSAFAPNTANLRIVRFNKNGTTPVGYSRVSASIVPDQQPTVSGELHLVSGDYVSAVNIYQDSGSALNFAATFTLSYLGPA